MTKGTGRLRWLSISALVVPILAALCVVTPVLAATRLVVPAGANSGDCTVNACGSITYALSVAADSDTISVAAGTYADSDIAVTKSVTIAGAGAATTAVFPPSRGLSPPGRLFLIAAGKTVTISGLTIRDGYPGPGVNGGGILNYGFLTLTNNVVTKNRVNAMQTPQTFAHGGGIANAIGGTLTLNTTTVSGNTAGSPLVPDANDPACGGKGGGIATEGTGAVTLNYSTISSNQAISLNTCAAEEGYGGGIVIVDGSALVSLNHSIVTGNSADYIGSAIATAGIYVQQASIGTVTLDHSTVSDQLTNSLSKDIQSPVIDLSQMNLVMTFATITGNNGGAVNQQTNNNYVCLTMTDSTISGNTASSSYTGGIQSGGSSCATTITRSVISNNRSVHTNPGDSTIYSNGAPGGIATSGEITITDSQITGNTGQDGGIAVYSGNLTIARSAVSNNVALPNGPPGGYATVGAGGLNAGLLSLTITDSTFAGNRSAGDGGAFSVGDGGGIFSDSGSTTITGTTISGNIAIHGSGLLTGSHYAGAVTLTNSTISGNTGGSAIENPYSASVTLTNTTIANNATGVANPGRVPNYPGKLTVTNSILKNSGPNCAIGTITSGGYNVVSDVSCGFASGGTDLLNTDASIAALALNAPGATKTHALLPGSPALNRIPNTNGCNGATLTTDQRGVSRPQPAGGLCDVGAFEAAPTAPPMPTGLHVTAATYNSVSYAWTNPDPTANILVSDGTTLSHPDATTPPRLPAGTTTFTTYGIAYGSYGCLSIAAWNSVGASAWSTWVCGSVMPITPYNPHKMSATTSGVTFGWATYDSLSSIAAYDGTTNHALGVNATSYTAPVAAGYFACVTVAAYNATNTSPYSPWACGLAMPAMPTNVHVTGHTTTSVSFAWTNHDPYSGIALTNDGVHLLNEGINATSYTQMNMTANQYACIEIAAYNSSGASGYTTWVCGQAGP